MNHMMKQKPGRDDTVELWRFIFCIAVLGFHFFLKMESSILRAGYLGVEFFFILSGYGLSSYYHKKMQDKALWDRLTQLGYYIGGRIIKLYPLYIISLIFMLLIKIFQNHWSFHEVAAYLKLEWAELIWLQCGPLGNEVLISAHWYIPAMFWGSVMILCILMTAGKLGGLILCPIISIGIYGYYFRLIHKIDVIFSYHAVLRGIAGLALGVFIGFLIEDVLRTKAIKCEFFNGMAAKILYGLANGVLLFVFIYMNFGRRSNWDFVIIGIYAIAIFVLLLIRKPVSAKMSHLCNRLSSLTYPIYILQMPVIEVICMIIK